MKIRIGEVLEFATDFICEQAKKSHDFLKGSLSYNSPFRENLSAQMFEMCKPSQFQTSPDLLPQGLREGVEFA